MGGELERVRASFEKQGLMRLLGAEVVEAGEGRCVIEVPFSEELTQQERYFHGAVTATSAEQAPPCFRPAPSRQRWRNAGPYRVARPSS